MTTSDPGPGEAKSPFPWKGDEPPTEPPTEKPNVPEQQTTRKKRKPKKKRSRGAAVVNVAVTPETADHLRRCALALGLHLGRQASQGDTVAAGLDLLEKDLRANGIKVPKPDQG